MRVEKNPKAFANRFDRPFTRQCILVKTLPKEIAEVQCYQTLKVINLQKVLVSVIKDLFTGTLCSTNLTIRIRMVCNYASNGLDHA